MPKLEVNSDNLLKLIPQIKSIDELLPLLPIAKAEFDGFDEETGTLNVELNDTNRPDLWSAPGLARAIRGYLTSQYRDFDAEWSALEIEDTNHFILAKSNTQQNRPFVAACLAEYKIPSEEILVELIQTQEKIAGVFGNKRSRISMGLYNADLIQFPISYEMVPPDSIRFVPLQFEKELSLREILNEHPTGIEYRHIIQDWDGYPVLLDAARRALSLVPIINSNDLGHIGVGDKNLLIEATGTSFEHVNLAVNIFAADIEEMGGKIYPIKIKYEHKRAPSQEVQLPYVFNHIHKARKKELISLLGLNLSNETILELLRKMGFFPQIKNKQFFVKIPSYRRDIMHSVDLLEDIAIAYGYDNFQEVPLESYTIGQAKPIQHTIDSIRDLMIGLGYVEVFTYVLSNEDDCLKKMRISEKIVRIKNVMSQTFSVVRNSMLPVLFRIESENTGSRYPHRIFEIGEIARYNPQNEKAETLQSLGIINIGPNVTLANTLGDIWALLSTTGIEYEMVETNDPRFIEGRCAKVIVDNITIGIVGEFHPEVLENWGLTMPAAGGEIFVSKLYELMRA